MSCREGRSVAAATVLSLACVACGPQGLQPEQQAADIASDSGRATGPVRDEVEPAKVSTRECIGDEYALRYPADWQVNQGQRLHECSLFDPASIQVPEASELPPSIAVIIDMEPVPFATVAGDVRGRRELDREQATVDGRRAVRIHAESTGEGLYDRGLRSYQYLVDLDGTTLIASTYDAGTHPFERKRRVLDAMMESLEFRNLEQAPGGQ